MIEGFEDLECYKAARELRRKASALCRNLPPDERFRLVDQLIRSSRSVTANIAEGFGRHHHQDHLQFLRNARGSLYETMDHFHTALDDAYISEEEHNHLVEEAKTALRILNGYIRYIRSCVEK